MKIRSDFVSNSSSSSFVVIGTSFSEDKIIEMAKKHGISEDELHDDEELWDAVEFLTKKFSNLTFECGLDNFYEEWCVGFRYTDMKKDETREEFEERIAECLEKMSGEKCKVELCIDGGYN